MSSRPHPNPPAPAQPGGGAYDAEVSLVQRSTDAQIALLIVVGGNRGNGFSVASVGEQSMAPLPGVLRNIADQMEAASG